MHTKFLIYITVLNWESRLYSFFKCWFTYHNFCYNVKFWPTFIRKLENLDPTLCARNIYRVSQKKRNTFDLEYLKDTLVRLIILLVCYLLLQCNSIKPNFSFLWLSKAKTWSFKVEVWFSYFCFIYQNWEVIVILNQIILKEFFWDTL